MGERFWLSDTQWGTIEPLLPHLGGKPRVDDRRVISGILHRYREGLRWRAIPPSTVRARRCSTGSIAGAGAGCGRSCWQPSRPVPSRPTRPWWTAPSCGPTVRRPAQKGQQDQAIGRSRGGPTTKIHALADGHGRLYALMLTAGQVHDVLGGRALLARVPPMRRLIADKAYDAEDVRDVLAAQGTEAVISPMPRRLVRPAFDLDAYTARNIIERAFCRLKDWRATATRYDKTARNFFAGLCLAVALTHWLR